MQVRVISLFGIMWSQVYWRKHYVQTLLPPQYWHLLSSCTLTRRMHLTQETLQATRLASVLSRQQQQMCITAL